MAKDSSGGMQDETLLAERARKGDQKEWTLDSVLGCGKYQHFQVWVTQCLIAIIGALNYYHLVFMVADPPDWGCVDDFVEKCGEDTGICGGGEIYFNTSHQNYIYSLPVEHIWLCSQQLLGPGVLTSFYVGMIINSLVFGQLCDTWGRKPVFHLTNITFIICRLISFHISNHYIPFILLTGLGTGFFPVGVRAGYTIVAEICDEKGRKFAFISGWCWWVVGLAVLPFMAKYLGDWYSLGMATTLVNIILILFYPLLPESPRWLLGQGKFKEAARIIERMRKVNGDPAIPNLPEVLEKIGKGDRPPKEESVNCLTVIKKKSIVRNAVCMALLWSVNDYFYVAGSMNVENLAGDMFVNFSLLSLTEMPSVFIGQFLIDRYGRRWIHTICLVISTLPFLISIFLVTNSEMGTVVVILSIFSKIASNVGWFIMWVQCIEVFPTPLRGTGMNVSVMVSTLIGMTGPYVVDLGSSHDLRYPFSIFAMFGILGIIVSTLVPETKGRPLAEKIEDIDEMVADFRFFRWKTWQDSEEENLEKPS